MIILRFLSFHVDFFWYKVTKKGRSGIVEEINDDNREGSVKDALVLFVSIEKNDEVSQDFIEGSILEIEKITKQLKVSNIVIIPFAHLFGKLSSLEFAFKSLKEINEVLKNNGYSSIRIPFGWFNELEMKAKGHPLSRISKIIN